MKEPFNLPYYKLSYETIEDLTLLDINCKYAAHGGDMDALKILENINAKIKSLQEISNSIKVQLSRTQNLQVKKNKLKKQAKKTS